MNQLLQGGTVVSGDQCFRADVRIENGIVTEVAENLPQYEEKIWDVSGKLLFPGFIDAHTHLDLEVSGTVTADDFASGTGAAIVGGTTMIVDFATQNKGETLAEGLENWHKKANGKSFCDYGFHMAISDWNEKTSFEMADMIKEGITSFKVYMTYDNMVLDDGAIYQVLKRAKELGGLVGVHCENMLLIKELAAEQKLLYHLGPSAHPLTRPACVEAEAVQRLLTIAKLAGTPVMIVHLSSREGYIQMDLARKEGQQIFAETCPQYLILDDGVYRTPGFEGAKYVCSPPLRKKEDQECLWSALAKDKIQIVSTDHCSFTMEQKKSGQNDFTAIPNGMPGLEHRPVLMYTYGVKCNRISLEQMCRLLSENPAKLYGIYPKKGVIRPGSDADIVVWDSEHEWTITAENQHYHMDYAPFEGMRAIGRAELVLLRGLPVAGRGEIKMENAGQFVKRGKWEPLNV